MNASLKSQCYFQDFVFGPLGPLQAHGVARPKVVHFNFTISCVENERLVLGHFYYHEF